MTFYPQMTMTPTKGQRVPPTNRRSVVDCGGASPRRASARREWHSSTHLPRERRRDLRSQRVATQAPARPTCRLRGASSLHRKAQGPLLGVQGLPQSHPVSLPARAVRDVGDSMHHHRLRIAFQLECSQLVRRGGAVPATRLGRSLSREIVQGEARKSPDRGSGLLGRRRPIQLGLLGRGGHG